MRPLLTSSVVACAVVLAGCSSSPDSAGTAAPSQAGVHAVASTSILGDVLADVVECGGGSTTVLMPPGADPHDFAPSSEQVANLVSADLVVVNGLGLEPGLDGALEAARSDGANVLAVGDVIDPLPLQGGGEGVDPHLWMDMARMSVAAKAIGEALTEATGDAAYTSCAQVTAKAISEADTAVRARLQSVPESSRILVTDHEALGYLANAYGYTIVGTVIPAATTLAEPSSADLAALAAEIRASGVPAIFSNAGQPTALADAVAAEAGTSVDVVPLFVESLGEPGSPAATYIGMMEENARLISQALGGT